MTTLQNAMTKEAEDLMETLASFLDRLILSALHKRRQTMICTIRIRPVEHQRNKLLMVWSIGSIQNTIFKTMQESQSKSMIQVMNRNSL